MLSSMLGERIPLSKLQIIDEFSSPLKRKAKIFSKKLPDDFFQGRKTAIQTERSMATPERQNIQTQSFSRKMQFSGRLSETRDANIRREEVAQKDHIDDSSTIRLFMGIISSTREIRKSIRKHSLELKK